MRSGCSLVILAGGQSRRMGRDKAGLPAGDGTLVEHLAHRLAPRIEALLIAGERSVRSLLARCAVRYLTALELRAVDPGLRSFRNVNTPADYATWLKTRSS